jgi:hypothetical protein
MKKNLSDQNTLRGNIFCKDFLMAADESITISIETLHIQRKLNEASINFLSNVHQ